MSGTAGLKVLASFGMALLPVHAAWALLIPSPGVPLPKMLAESDAVVEVHNIRVSEAPAEVLARIPMVPCRATVLRVLKGPPVLQGRNIQWEALDLPPRFGRPDLKGSARALVFLKAAPEGAYELTHPGSGFIGLPARPPAEHLPDAEPLEAIRAELLHCLEAEDWGLAYAAARHLGYFPFDQATEDALAELLHRLEPGLATTACTALIRMGSAKGVQAATYLLSEAPPPATSPDTRSAWRTLVNTIRALKDERHLKHVLALMEAPGDDVREAAAHALGSMPSPEAVKALGEALWDPDQMVRYRAIQSLCEITCTRPGAPMFSIYDADEDKYLGFWRKWYEEVGRPAVQEPEAEAKQ